MASATTLSPPDMSKLSVYDHATAPTSNGNMTNTSVDFWVNLIRNNLATARVVEAADSDGEDAATPLIKEEVMNAPRRKSARETLARNVAERLYPAPPDSLAPIIQYEKDVVKLRSMILHQRRSAIAKAAERNARFNWVKRISKQGPWAEINDPLSTKGAPSLPMPVEQSDRESLAPLFAHLRNDGTHQLTGDSSQAGSASIEPYYNTELIEFEKGVLYADGRIDLCKMVAGPRNIGDLMESLKLNTFSKHFLLGNNIVGPTGAKAIARFIEEFPDRFETWYLAGNCIDGPAFRTALINSMVKSPAITNVWLKRNPLGPSAAKDVYHLITQTSNLRTLDLDQTELSDAGVAELFELLCNQTPTQSLALRHLYMNACGIGERACKQIAQYLQSPHCTLESLYISSNPIGHAAAVLADGLRNNKSLKRIALQSCGLKDENIISLADALKDNHTITALDIGQGYATEDLGMRFNWITDQSADALVSLIKTSKLQYLNLSYTPMSQTALSKVLEAISGSDSLVWFHAKPLVTGDKDAASVKAGQEHARLYKLARERLHKNVKKQYDMDYVHFESEHKRFLISPKDVRFIDSVYRNRDAAAARRGLKKLEKWWDEDDETLRRVQDGTLA
ncbi:hypothetical protein LTR37_012554 [Vermiconidia calcicola]|uniref:Uncharacterized protein n=1 Tax=Vermiconidia calcicola TaxID=1690605 RepID=A0ACC3MZH0_9PEZI|nr:hypothetical protein LTR37_012554 [Vermiconidia calcicola]